MDSMLMFVIFFPISIFILRITLPGLIARLLAKIAYGKRSSKKTKDDATPHENDGIIEYQKKALLTQCEKNFLDALHGLLAYNLIIVPQVNLASVIQKVGNYRYQNELYRNIDFGIFDSEYNLLLLIELNDRSHQNSDRIERDKKVKSICEKAKIELITFYTNMPNKPDYVVTRVLDELNIERHEDSQSSQLQAQH